MEFKYRFWTLTRDGRAYHMSAFKQQRFCEKFSRLCAHYYRNDSVLAPFWVRDIGTNVTKQQRCVAVGVPVCLVLLGSIVIVRFLPQEWRKLAVSVVMIGCVAAIVFEGIFEFFALTQHNYFDDENASQIAIREYERFQRILHESPMASPNKAGARLKLRSFFSAKRTSLETVAKSAMLTDERDYQRYMKTAFDRRDSFLKQDGVVLFADVFHKDTCDVMAPPFTFCEAEDERLSALSCGGAGVDGQITPYGSPRRRSLMDTMALSPSVKRRLRHIGLRKIAEAYEPSMISERRTDSESPPTKTEMSMVSIEYPIDESKSCRKPYQMVVTSVMSEDGRHSESSDETTESISDSLSENEFDRLAFANRIGRGAIRTPPRRHARQDTPWTTPELATPMSVDMAADSFVTTSHVDLPWTPDPSEFDGARLSPMVSEQRAAGARHTCERSPSVSYCRSDRSMAPSPPRFCHVPEISFTETPSPVKTQAYMKHPPSAPPLLAPRGDDDDDDDDDDCSSGRFAAGFRADGGWTRHSWNGGALQRASAIPLAALDEPMHTPRSEDWTHSDAVACETPRLHRMITALGTVDDTLAMAGELKTVDDENVTATSIDTERQSVLSEPNSPRKAKYSHFCSVLPSDGYNLREILNQINERREIIKAYYPIERKTMERVQVCLVMVMVALLVASVALASLWLDSKTVIVEKSFVGRDGRMRGDLSVELSSDASLDWWLRCENATEPDYRFQMDEAYTRGLLREQQHCSDELECDTKCGKWLGFCWISGFEKANDAQTAVVVFGLAMLVFFAINAAYIVSKSVYRALYGYAINPVIGFFDESVKHSVKLQKSLKIFDESEIETTVLVDSMQESSMASWGFTEVDANPLMRVHKIDM
jgi:hypothetical protein